MKESEKYIDNLNLSEEEVLKDIVEIIIEHFSPDRIILFGSRAAPTHSPESDYDICILKSGIEHKRKFSQAIYTALAECPVALDLIVDTPERFDSLKNDPYLIYHQIDIHGKTLYKKA